MKIGSRFLILYAKYHYDNMKQFIASIACIMTIIPCCSSKVSNNTNEDVLRLYRDRLGEYHLTSTYNSAKVINIRKQVPIGNTLVVYYKSGLFVKENSLLNLTEKVRFVKCYYGHRKGIQMYKVEQKQGSKTISLLQTSVY
ncbi:hypothetical protein FACS1894159_10940 [Bacteroidia bacterium]|nr:hypothetical protein FACS1894159_10940 [Bacteroidia bacterium]